MSSLLGLSRLLLWDSCEPLPGGGNASEIRWLVLGSSFVFQEFSFSSPSFLPCPLSLTARAAAEIRMRRDAAAMTESGACLTDSSGGFFQRAVFYEKGVVMNQDMNMGMMVCMVAGVSSSLAIVALVLIQTFLQNRILKEVRRITQKSGRVANS